MGLEDSVEHITEDMVSQGRTSSLRLVGPYEQMRAIRILARFGYSQRTFTTEIAERGLSREWVCKCNLHRLVDRHELPKDEADSVEVSARIS